jgi:hypothetical protein
LLRVVFVEHHHRIHAAERGQHLRAFVFGVDGSRRALDGFRGSV